MKQQPSAIAMTSLSGHSGGTTATITNIVRRKSNPRQPRTTKQSAVRALLTQLSTSWGGESAANQDAWIAAAPNYLITKNGVSTPLKGNTAYIRANYNLTKAGQSQIHVPVAPVAFPNIKIASAAAAAGTPALTLTVSGATTVPSGFTLMIVATPCFSPGKRSVSNKIRLLGTTTLTSSVANILSIWEAYPGYGAPVAGMRIEVGFYLVSNTTGQETVPQTIQIVVAA